MHSLTAANLTVFVSASFGRRNVQAATRMARLQLPRARVTQRLGAYQDGLAHCAGGASS